MIILISHYIHYIFRSASAMTAETVSYLQVNYRYYYLIYTLRIFSMGLALVNINSSITTTEQLLNTIIAIFLIYNGLVGD